MAQYDLEIGAIVSLQFPKNKFGGRASGKYFRYWIQPEGDQIVEPNGWYEVKIVGVNPKPGKNFVLYCTLIRQLRDDDEIDAARRLLRSEENSHRNARKRKANQKQKRKRIPGRKASNGGRDGKWSRRNRNFDEDGDYAF